MDKIEYFKNNKYFHFENLISPEIVNFLYNYFVIKSCTNRSFSDTADQSLEISHGGSWLKGCYGDIATETLMSQLEHKIAEVTQKKLCPTYSYSRVYIHGDELKIHSDRPACQYSITLNLGGDPWPIYFGVFDENSKDSVVYQDKKVKVLNELTLNPGDGVIYMGEDLLHWRMPFSGDHCIQTFLHYVDAEDDKYKPEHYDGRYNIGYIK